MSAKTIEFDVCVGKSMKVILPDYHQLWHPTGSSQGVQLQYGWQFWTGRVCAGRPSQVSMMHLRYCTLEHRPVNSPATSTKCTHCPGLVQSLPLRGGGGGGGSFCNAHGNTTLWVREVPLEIADEKVLSTHSCWKGIHLVCVPTLSGQSCQFNQTINLH